MKRVLVCFALVASMFALGMPAAYASLAHPYTYQDHYTSNWTKQVHYYQFDNFDSLGGGATETNAKAAVDAGFNNLDIHDSNYAQNHDGESNTGHNVFQELQNRGGPAACAYYASGNPESLVYYGPGNAYGFSGAYGVTAWCDTNNNGIFDFFIMGINSNANCPGDCGGWHYDPTTAPGALQIDMYGVVAHEALHASGFNGHWCTSPDYVCGSDGVALYCPDPDGSNADQRLTMCEGYGNSNGGWARSLEFDDYSEYDQQY